MPAYPWLIHDDLNLRHTAGKVEAMRTLGVPYPADWDETKVLADVRAQSQAIAQRLQESEIQCAPEKEIIALIAYLQRLGTDIQLAPKAPAK